MKASDVPYAEDCNYWNTSRSAPDTRMEKIIRLIVQFGGTVLTSGFGNEHSPNRAAYMIRFSMEGEMFRIVWPVLTSEKGNTFAARRQATTMLYHDVKAKCVSAQVLGARAVRWCPTGSPTCMRGHPSAGTTTRSG